MWVHVCVLCAPLPVYTYVILFISCIILFTVIFISFILSLIFADDVATLVGTSGSNVSVECQALDSTTVLGTPIFFYPWSTTVQMQLSQTSLGSAGGFTCSLPPYQTAQIDVRATLTNSETSPSQIQANIYSLVRDKVRTYICLCTHIVCINNDFQFSLYMYTQHILMCMGISV